MTIQKIKRETCPAARFIGKKYSGPADWGEWWANGWFDTLENMPGLLPINDGGYSEAIHTANGTTEHWLGMFFSADVDTPAGFESVDMPAIDYAVCYLYGNPDNGELFGHTAHEQCLEALKEQGISHREGDWCFQRCNCPRFTEPDELGNVVLDYAISIDI